MNALGWDYKQRKIRDAARKINSINLATLKRLNALKAFSYSLTQIVDESRVEWCNEFVDLLFIAETLEEYYRSAIDHINRSSLDIRDISERLKVMNRKWNELNKSRSTEDDGSTSKARLEYELSVQQLVLFTQRRLKSGFYHLSEGIKSMNAGEKEIEEFAKSLIVEKDIKKIEGLPLTIEPQRFLEDVEFGELFFSSDDESIGKESDKFNHEVCFVEGINEEEFILQIEEAKEVESVERLNVSQMEEVKEEDEDLRNESHQEIVEQSTTKDINETRDEDFIIAKTDEEEQVVNEEEIKQQEHEIIQPENIIEDQTKEYDQNEPVDEQTKSETDLELKHETAMDYPDEEESSKDQPLEDDNQQESDENISSIEIVPPNEVDIKDFKSKDKQSKQDDQEQVDEQIEATKQAKEENPPAEEEILKMEEENHQCQNVEEIPDQQEEELEEVPCLGNNGPPVSNKQVDKEEGPEPVVDTAEEKLELVKEETAPIIESSQKEEQISDQIPTPDREGEDVNIQQDNNQNKTEEETTSSTDRENLSETQTDQQSCDPLQDKEPEENKTDIGPIEKQLETESVLQLKIE